MSRCGFYFAYIQPSLLSIRLALPFEPSAIVIYFIALNEQRMREEQARFDKRSGF